QRGLQNVVQANTIGSKRTESYRTIRYGRNKENSGGVESMRLNKTDTIGGVPVLTARSLFRKVGDWRHGFSKSAAGEFFGSENETLKALRALEKDGYLTSKPDPNNKGQMVWNVTNEAMQVRMAKLRDYTRSTADRAFKEFLDRVKTVNTPKSEHLFWVEAIYGFGSFFFGTGDRVGDIDIVGLLRHRYEWEEYQNRQAEMVAKLNRRVSFPEKLFHASWAVRGSLKGRSGIISLHELNEWNDLKKMLTEWKLLYQRPGTSLSDLEAEIETHSRGD